MELDIPYSKFKILFINIFSILYKAATLNPHKLQLDLREIKNALETSNNFSLLPHLLIFLISLLVVTKFLIGYIGLATNVVAMFPILTDDQPELLLPTIVSQTIENIILCIMETLLGYIAISYYVPGKMALFTIFIGKMLLKMSLSISTLNSYSDLYHKIKFPLMYEKSDETLPGESSEQFVQKLSLFE